MNLFHSGLPNCGCTLGNSLPQEDAPGWIQLCRSTRIPIAWAFAPLLLGFTPCLRLVAATNRLFLFFFFPPLLTDTKFITELSKGAADSAPSASALLPPSRRLPPLSSTHGCQTPADPQPSTPRMLQQQGANHHSPGHAVTPGAVFPVLTSPKDNNSCDHIE